MRRSRAPSQLGKNPSTPGQHFKEGETGTVQGWKSGTPSFNSRNFLHHLNSSSQSSENNQVGNSLDTERKPTVTTSSSGIKKFNVVYGKQSKKKHKTWEGDGTLEVGLKTATLKDSDGKILGQTSCKGVTLEEGSRLFVGSKEVEIVDELGRADEAEASPPSKRRATGESGGTPSAQQNDPPAKPISEEWRPPLVDSSNRGSFAPPRKAAASAALKMPTPDDEHQWVFNVDFLPLTDVVVDSSLSRVLRPHQKEGVVFLYRCLTGMRHHKQMGAILSDEMGLGKTLQCVVLIWTLLKQGPYGGRPLLRRALVIAPSSLVSNWASEFKRWLGSHRLAPFVVDKKNKPSDYKKMSHIPVLIISYEMIVRGFEDIKEIKFDLVVCDEGHRLRNSNIRTATVLNQIECARRIILTGTPVQNDLQEFYSLVDFVNPGLLGPQSEFRKKFEEVIVASREAGATEEAVEKGAEAGEELARLTRGFILRRTQEVINTFLPHKHEYVIFIRPTRVQATLYSAATEHWHRVYEEGINSNESVIHLTVITALKKICNHPALVKTKGSDNSVLSELLSLRLKELNALKPSAEDSSKLMVVRALLREASAKKEKIVLVSSFTQTLDLLGALCDESLVKVLRFDGSTPVAKRADIVSRFNSPTSETLVLLLSSKAGGVGLNLIGGSRLVLFDSDWNPATDMQAMARIWREGQKKSVHIYRLLTSGTIEEKIFQRQLSKAGLSESVVDTNCISDVKLSSEELKDLFSYTEGVDCSTHEMLKCACSGSGEAPQVEEEEQPVEAEDVWESQIPLPTAQSKPPSSLRMNQLFKWEHHSHPIAHTVLEEMGLLEVQENISFMFRNKTV